MPLSLLMMEGDPQQFGIDNVGESLKIVQTQNFVYEQAAKLEVELLDVIKGAGVAVNNADNAAFIAASKPIYDEFAGSVEGGADLIKKVQSLASGS